MAQLVAALSRAGARAHDLLVRLSRHLWFWLLVMAVPFSWPFIYVAKQDPLPEPLPVYGTVPAFELVDHNGQPFTSDTLEGKIWVAGFIFTRCPTACPRITEQMWDIQHRSRNLGPVLQLVSLSVDPSFDTPEVLADYVAKHRVSSTMWSFVTGDTSAVVRAVSDGLKTAMATDEDQGHEAAGIFHGTHLVVVDKNMQIRGYYDSSVDDEVNRLLRDLHLVVHRGG